MQPGPRGRAWVARLLPGERVVWWAALAVFAVGLVLTVRLLGGPMPPVVGTNSVDVAAVVAEVPARGALCVRDLEVPDGTAAVRIWLGLTGVRGSELRGTLAVPGREVPIRYDESAGNWRTFKVPPLRGASAAPARLCVVAPRGRMDVGGASVQRISGRPVSTVGGRPLDGVDAAVSMLGSGESTSLGAAFPAALRRATLFKDYPGGSLVLWLVVLAFPVVAYGIVRVAATLDRRPVRGLATRAGLVALYASFAWAVMMPPFFGADESEHFAYVQHVAETGERASAGRTSILAYSSEQIRLLGALHHNSTILNGSSRPRWDDRWERIFEAGDGDAPRDDGGGYSESATGHSPLYYAVAAVPYLLLREVLDLPQLVVATRIWNAFGAALLAVLAVLSAARLAPHTRAAWWIAGMLVALQPVLSSVGATVSNDTLVNLLAALVIFLILDAWRRGPSVGRMAALGLCTALLPVAKITGFALIPTAALGMLVILWRHHKRADLVSMAAAPAAVLAAAFSWLVVVGPIFGGDVAIFNTHPAEPGVTPAITPLGTQLDYALQTVVPFVQITGQRWPSGMWPLYDIYIVRGWGRFGWLTAGLTPGIVRLIGIGLLGGLLLALVAAIQRRRTWREWLPPSGLLVVCVLGMLLFVAVAYAVPTPRSVFPEQGRYLFPALVPFAVIIGAGASALAGRWRSAYLGVVSAAMPVVAALGWLSAVRAWFI